MYGLFVRRHAAAATAAGDDVCVLYLHEVEDIKSCGVETHVTGDPTVNEIYVYYQGSYLKALYRGWKEVKLHWGMPDICQINIISKNAVLPLALKLFRHTPYIITEHWSGYLPQNNAFLSAGALYKALVKTVLRHADQLLTVSPELENGMRRCGLPMPHAAHINNVVDGTFYMQAEGQEQKAESKKSVVRFVHVSCFDEQAKNVCGILNTASTLANQRTDFEIVMIGTGADLALCRRHAARLHLPSKIIKWTGELPPEQVAQQLHEADAFILFSNYETAGVVLAESLAVGTPVISTPVGLAPELIDENCGIIVPVADEQALAQAMLAIMDKKKVFDEKKMRKKAADFTQEAVGNALHDVYQRVLESSHQTF